MGQDIPDAVAKRLERLERDHLRLKRLGVAGLLGLAALMLLLVGRPGSNVVEAQRFVLRDSRGAVRGMFATTGPAGLPLLGLYAPDARPRAEIGVTADGGIEVRLHDQAGNERFHLAVDATGTPLYRLLDESGTPRAQLVAAPQGDLTFELGRDVPGKLVLSSATERTLAIVDREGTVYVGFAMLRHGIPTLRLDTTDSSLDAVTTVHRDTRAKGRR